MTTIPLHLPANPYLSNWQQQPASNKYEFRQWAPSNGYPIRPMRKSVSFMEREAGQAQRLVLNECWPEPHQQQQMPSLPAAAVRPAPVTKKASRSKSFMETDERSTVRRMLKKSASILWKTGNKPSREPPANGSSAAVLDVNGTAGKNVMANVQALPRLSKLNRFVMAGKSPTAVDQPAVVAAASTGSSSSSSSAGAGHKTGRKMSAPAAGQHQAAPSNGLSRKASSASSSISKESQRRWQSLSTLQEAENSSSNGTGGEFEVSSFHGERPPDVMKMGRQGHSKGMMIKAESQHTVLMDSSPSYESLDDYLLTSDEDFRRNFRKAVGRPSLPYCDSFESLPRPPPPADADYSPPDISPDSSENNNRGLLGHHGRLVRNKLQRLPTFIQRQEAWQRTWRRPPEVLGSSSSPERGWLSREDEDDDDDDLSRDSSYVIHQPGSFMTTYSHHHFNQPAVYWHDWLPPPADLLDCGCGLCRLTAAINSRPPARLPPLPPRHPVAPIRSHHKVDFDDDGIPRPEDLC